MISVFIAVPQEDKDEQKISEIRSQAEKEAAEAVKKLYDDRCCILSDLCECCKGSLSPLFEEKKVNKEIMRLGLDITAIAEAQMVYFCKGWRSSDICQLERECAEVYGIKIIEQLEDGVWRIIN